MKVDIDNEQLQSDNDIPVNEADNVEDAEYEEVVEAEDERPAESVTDSDTEHEAKSGQEKPNPKVEERIGELTRKRREAERVAEQRQQELEKLQQQIFESQEPRVPDLPDPDLVGEREFNEAVQRRDEAVQARVAWTQQKNQYTQAQQYQSQQQQYVKQQELATAAQKYQANAKTLGISPEQLQKAGAIVSQVGLDEQLAMRILQDDKGAAITNYLGNNIAELLEVANSNPIDAAIYIETKVKPKLAGLKRKSNAPRPPNKVKGGTPDKRDKFPLTGGRAKFE